MNGLQSVWYDTYILIPNWKWLALVVIFSVGYLLQPASKWLLTKIKSSQTKNKALHRFVHFFFDLKIENPLSWMITIGLWYFAVDLLALPATFTKYVGWLLQIALSFYILRLCYLAVEALGQLFKEVAKKTDTTLDDQLVPMATKSLKVFVIVFGILIILQSFGFNVMSVLAGLGLGGLALALAAQDTAANLFGSIMIILDKPFNVGDYVKVANTEGTIEEIGFRSTRIRTPYKSLITIPNSTMAKELIDNLGARPSRRIRHILGITYDTPPEKMRQFMDQIRYMLTQHPDTIKDDITVRFNNMGDFNLQILVNFHINTTELSIELEIQEQILTEIMRAASHLGIEFAFPTQTLHVASLPTEKLPAFENTDQKSNY